MLIAKLKQLYYIAPYIHDWDNIDGPSKNRVSDLTIYELLKNVIAVKNKKIVRLFPIRKSRSNANYW